MFRHLLFSLVGAALLLPSSAESQTQNGLPLPVTMTTVAGGLTSTTFTAGTTLCPGSTTVKAITAYGDGCPAVSASFGSGGRGGAAVDTFGNIFIADDINKIAHMVDPTTGIMSVLAGGASAACAGKVDGVGDGCVAATQTTFSAASALRGIGLDPYGNVLLAGYNTNGIHMVCRQPSPLCTEGTPSPSATNPIQVQIGYMGLVAGCMGSTTGVGTGGTGADNKPAFSTSVSVVPAFKNTGSCSASLGETNGPRGAAADIYGNIYYADTGTSRTRVVLGPLTSPYFAGNNPLYAALETHWAAPIAGYAYTLVNQAGTGTATGGTATATGASCSDSASGTTYTGTATDIRGDGCPYWLSSVDASSGYTNGVAVDAAGNMIFTDPGNGSTVGGGIRVFFVQGWPTIAAASAAGATGSVATAGVAMYKAIVTNNSAVTPTAGFIYSLAGGAAMQTTVGGTALSASPVLGNNAKITDSTITRVTVSPQGNIYVGDNAQVLFYDMQTGYIRILLTSAGANPAKGAACHGSNPPLAIDAFGDGCPATASAPYAKFGNSNGLNVSVDGQGNLYLYDANSLTTGMLVRKVLAQGSGIETAQTLAALATTTTSNPPQALGVTQQQTFALHFPNATGATNNTITGGSGSFNIPSATCTFNSAAGQDNSADCLLTATITPNGAGVQSATATVAISGGASATLQMAGTSFGSVLSVDGATSGGAPILHTSQLLSGSTPSWLAVDPAGTVYETSGSSILATSGSLTRTIASGLSGLPGQVVVDQTGNLFYLNGSSSIQELAVNTTGSSSTYSASSIPYTPSNLGTAKPTALAVDQSNNLVVADQQSGVSTLYRISPAAVTANTPANCLYPATNSALPSLCQTQIYNAGAFGAVSALTTDSAGNIFVADSTNSTVYELSPAVDQNSTDSTYKQYVYSKSTVLSGVLAEALAVDAAGDLYVQYASGTNGVVEYPLASPASGVNVLPSVTAPAGLGLDAQGNLYSADAATTAVTKVIRSSVTENFASNNTLKFAATITNTGNQNSSQQTATSTTGAQATDFNLAGGTTSPCTFTNSLLNSVSAGQACTLTATFPAIGNTTETDYIAFGPASPALASAGLLTLTGIANTEAFTTTIAIGSGTPAAPVYSATGTEISFPITVTASSTSQDGTVTGNSTGPSTSQYVSISVDGGASTNYYFTATSGLSASVTVGFTGLTAGNHTFSASFPTQGSFLSSNASSGTFTIAQVPTVLSWTPASNGQQVSAPVGTANLNAAISPAISGNFIYSTTAAPACNATNAGTVDASTYLPIGNYTIYATFCPNDATDYASASMSIHYSVSKASTNAAVGATTMLVAPSGGNFNSLTAALQALPSSGGTIYFAPGTYTGQNAISYPNVALRGLGGDPTQVVITAENGAFSSSTLPPSFTLGPAGKGGDEGSATLDVSKNGYIGMQVAPGSYTPNNFYAENLTIQNTYNTDAATTTTTTASSNGGTCANGSTAYSLQYLYNHNQQCGSQALALYLNSDTAVLNNVNLVSQQDTLYASSLGCGAYCTVAREYMWKGTIVGDVDYVFGDAALVFDHTNFFTTWHGLTATGQETIEAQNKRFPTGTTPATNSTSPTSSDYLSGFICNGCNLLSQSTGMTSLYYGRPYDISTSSYPSSYSTWIMLNSYVDQVNPKGWIGWDGGSEYLSTSTYGEYNTQAYSDPAVGTFPYPAALFNATPSILYSNDSANQTATSVIPTGANTGSYGVTSTSTTPASREPSALTLTAAQAGNYFPVNFLSTTVPATKLSSGQPANWNPVTTLAQWVNTFVPSANVGALANGSSVTILGRPQTPGAGMTPTGTYAFYDSFGSNQACSAVSAACTLLASGNLDASGEAYLTTSTLAPGNHYLTMVYGGDSNFSGSTSTTYDVYVLNPGQAATTAALSVNNTSSTVGNAVTGNVTITPNSAPGSVTILVDGTSATSCTLSAGSCAWSISGLGIGAHTVASTYTGNASFGQTTSPTVGIAVVAAIATGDSRTVTEPAFPAVCTQLQASLTADPAIHDLDPAVDATNTNIDGARIQQALNNCSQTATTAGTNLAVELSKDSTGTNDSFLAGPLSMPSNVTLTVDPGVTLFFSRNAQDYDAVQGIHTCGTINAGSNLTNCKPLIDIPATSTNVGIMGYGKLDGRGGDALLNGFATAGYTAPSTYTWWNLAAQANGEGNQQNPRFVLMEAGSSNITLYKITLLNSPQFHVSTSGGVTNFTAWDVKIITPTSARNTDGIDPANVVNGTIRGSWISDGDDNVAVSAPGTTAPAQNISVVGNHFFAGHGESIGSYTGAGVSNILFDSNMSAGNAWAGYGAAAISGSSDTNSTGVRIKSANDRGGLVTNIQYSNSCFYNHKADIQLTPYYSAGDSTSLFPSYTNIRMQNLLFATDSPTSVGTVELTGEFNSNNGSPVTNPLSLTMDNVTFPSTLSSLVYSAAPVETGAVWPGSYSGGTFQYVNLQIGPGQVSSNFLSLYNALAAVPTNADTISNNATLAALDPPSCSFTYLVPELTGPTGTPQTISQGNSATLDVILTPAVAGSPYPNGTVQIKDLQSGNTFSGTFAGNTDLLPVTIPASDLTVGNHTFQVVSYSGDANYTVPNAYQTFGSYNVTVKAPAVNVTGSVSVTSSGIVYNRVTHVGTLTFTVQNTSSATLAGPLELVLALSNTAVTAGNASGTYAGNPYWSTSSSLAPGASVQFAVTLKYPLGTTFTTTPSVYSGGF